MENLLSTWRTLATNVDQFFEKNSLGLNCSQGCSKCCEVDRSVFGIEAQVIANHIEGLTDQEYEELCQKIENSESAAKGHCAFLDEGKCLVYQARPLICRSHGLVHLREGQPHHCDLNFTEALPPKDQWLDEERLGLMLAMLQKEYDKAPDFPTRVPLSELARALNP